MSCRQSLLDLPYQAAKEGGLSSAKPLIEHFYDEPTGTISYVVADPATRFAAVIDPVLGFDPVSGRTDPEPARRLLRWIDEQNYSIQWILETHAHADHLTAAQWIKQSHGGTVAIGRGICNVQEHFAKVFNLGIPFVADGRQFDHLFTDGENFRIGTVSCRVMATPGHTRDSISYVIGDAVFVGDSLFMADFGTARCDFPGGDARQLYRSIQQLFELPDETRLYMCHDYRPGGRDLRWVSTVAEQKLSNVHVRAGVTEDNFVQMRTERDQQLDLPKLIVPAIQVNIRAGHLPDAEDNGVAYLKTPVDQL